MKPHILKALVGMSCALQFGFSLAKNVSLEDNAENCAKVKGWSRQYEEAVSINLKFRMRDLDFIRTEYRYGCNYIIDTPTGLKACPIPIILQPLDEQKPAFAGVDVSEFVRCTQK